MKGDTDPNSGDNKRVVFARVPPQLHRGLKESARKNHRSMTQELAYLVETHIAPAREPADSEPEGSRREPGTPSADQAAA